MGKYIRKSYEMFENPRTTRSSGQCFKGDLRADVDCPEVWVECKVGKRPNIKAALEQAEEAEAGAKTGKSPVAICKWDRQEPIASMRLDFFIELLKIAYRGEGDDGGNTLVQTTDDNKRA